jgi:hypothetical protein
MNKTIVRAIESAESQSLVSQGLKLVSTQRQLQNGTIALSGTVQGQEVSYKITANGIVLSNDYVARKVKGSYPLQQYRAGLRAAGELLAKRIGV